VTGRRPSQEPAKPTRESRQARRWRLRQEAKRPVLPDGKPSVVMCRVEDDHGDGGWVMTDVATPAEGDAFARELQGAADEVLPSTRGDLVANTEEGLHAWASHSVTRRAALRLHGTGSKSPQRETP
jgi:hypothetical protein